MDPDLWPFEEGLPEDFSMKINKTSHHYQPLHMHAQVHNKHASGLFQETAASHKISLVFHKSKQHMIIKMKK